MAFPAGHGYLVIQHRVWLKQLYKFKAQILVFKRRHPAVYAPLHYIVRAVYWFMEAPATGHLLTGASSATDGCRCSFPSWCASVAFCRRHVQYAVRRRT